jgi:ATP-binding protein involved in chromosome partitioning
MQRFRLCIMLPIRDMRTMKKQDCKSCTSASCSTQAQRADENSEEFLERQELSQRMCNIKHKILVLSGKGGVGKSTVAANLAVALSKSGNKVGLLDVDIHGPSIPTMFGLQDASITPGKTENSIPPIEVSDNLKTMSIGFLLAKKDDALIWRGPMKNSVIKQFLKDVEWGELDYLIADLPPGTGDEPLSLCQLIGDVDGAIVVTTPQEIALVDVRKSINFCRKLKLPVLGVIENMSGFVCPKCGEITDIFKKGGAEEMCRKMEVPFAGRIPLTAEIVEAGDSGTLSTGNSAVSDLFKPIIESIMLR